MADLPLTLTNAGKAALAAAHAAGLPFLINKIKLGTGQYVPDGTELDIMTPFVPVKELLDPAGSVSGQTFQFTFNEPSSNVYNIGEFGIFLR